MGYFKLKVVTSSYLIDKVFFPFHNGVCNAWGLRDSFLSTVLAWVMLSAPTELRWIYTPGFRKCFLLIHLFIGKHIYTGGYMTLATLMPYSGMDLCTDTKYTFESETHQRFSMTFLMKWTVRMLSTWRRPSYICFVHRSHLLPTT